MIRIVPSHIVSLFCVAVLPSCFNPSGDSQSQPTMPQIKKIKNTSTGSWSNLHAGNTDLAGVVVQQFPDNPYDAYKWEGRHPAMIMFVMWDGRVHQVDYSPSGSMSSEFWWNIKKSDHSYIWKNVEYKHGSDPGFLRHKDPRKD